MTQPLRHPALYTAHEALQAKFAEFSGWSMPLEYAGGGVLKEHAAVREAVGVFDVSHLGKARVRGSGAVEFVNRCLSNDLDRIGAGQAQYTLCCAADGGVVDDLIAYRFSDDEVFLVPNAANTAEVVRRLAAAAPEGVTVHNEHDDYVVLAVQGPKSADLLGSLGLPSSHDYMSFAMAPYRGVNTVVCRTGYTGEHGYELILPSPAAAPLWTALVDAGARPCGLAARDTLRTEMGYALHGHELSLDISPVQARVGWAVGWKKPEFWGREALLAEKAAGPHRQLWGIEALDRGIPRPHMTVLRGDDPVGEVTSGTFSPTLQKSIAMAFVDANLSGEGTQLAADLKGTMNPAKIVKLPFYKRPA